MSDEAKKPFREWAESDPAFKRSLLFVCGSEPVTEASYRATKRAIDAGWRAAKNPMTGGMAADWSHVPFGATAFTVARSVASKHVRR